MILYMFERKLYHNNYNMFSCSVQILSDRLGGTAYLSPTHCQEPDWTETSSS